jgi:hypothetical protein
MANNLVSRIIFAGFSKKYKRHERDGNVTKLFWCNLLLEAECTTGLWDGRSGDEINFQWSEQYYGLCACNDY